MIPEFSGGTLPEGVHPATITEVEERFASTPWRRSIFGGLLIALADLREVGCLRVWLDGSYVTDKERPGDFDLCWDFDGVDLDALNPALRDIHPPRPLQQERYRGDVLPNVVELGSGLPIQAFFQQNKETGGTKGILELAL
jgi:hypothetical protein